jgi:3-methyl-2-oxobutanoate hydroxymethyltransferase
MKTIQDFAGKKRKKEKISMITCYDHSFAKIISRSSVDCILVGDSVAQVVHGFPTTLQATTEMMALHTGAVVRGAEQKFVVTDMPFLSTRKGLKHAMDSVQKIMVAGANAIKIEGALGHLDLIQHIVESGVPVMGHLGLTPQSIHQLSGPKVQGKTEGQAAALLKHAQQLQNAGCFALVLECVPALLGEEITQALTIPTIGIGAGIDTDGQVLVLHDMLGMNPDFSPKFLKKYAQEHELVLSTLNQYADEVTRKIFPAAEHGY